MPVFVFALTLLASSSIASIRSVLATFSLVDFASASLPTRSLTLAVYVAFGSLVLNSTSYLPSFTTAVWLSPVLDVTVTICPSSTLSTVPVIF